MAHVQTRSAHSTSSPVTVSITTTAGNLLGIATGSFGTAAGAPTRTGDTNNVAVANFADVGGDNLRGDYMMNIGGNSNVVSASGSVPNGTACCVSEFSGRPTTSALDSAAVNHAVGASTTIQPGSVTPTAGTDLMTATGDDGAGTAASTVNSSFTVDEAGGSGTVWDAVAAICGSAHLDNAPASAVNPTWTTGHSGVGHMAALIMGFLPTGGGGGGFTAVDRRTLHQFGNRPGKRQLRAV